MPPCKCGSWAINLRLHGRDSTDLDLCDVCYWRKRADKYHVDTEMLDWVSDNKISVDYWNPKKYGKPHWELSLLDSDAVLVVHSDLRTAITKAMEEEK